MGMDEAGPRGGSERAVAPQYLLKPQNSRH
jgi:hypothetical protein